MNLTPRQARFVDEYLKDLNATAAYIRAGYRARGNSAEVSAGRLLRNAQIAEAVTAAMAQRSARTKIDADRVLLELGRIAFLDVRRLFALDGSLRRLDELDDDIAAALIGVEISEIRNENGCVVGVDKKIKIADKLAALEKIARHLGMFNEKLKLKSDAANPIALMIRETQGTTIKPVAAPNDTGVKNADVTVR